MCRGGPAWTVEHMNLSSTAPPIEVDALTRRFGDEHAAYRKRKAALIPFVW